MADFTTGCLLRMSIGSPADRFTAHVACRDADILLGGSVTVSKEPSIGFDDDLRARREPGIHLSSDRERPEEYPCNSDDERDHIESRDLVHVPPEIPWFSSRYQKGPPGRFAAGQPDHWVCTISTTSGPVG